MSLISFRSQSGHNLFCPKMWSVRKPVYIPKNLVLLKVMLPTIGLRNKSVRRPSHVQGKWSLGVLLSALEEGCRGVADPPAPRHVSAEELAIMASDKHCKRNHLSNPAWRRTGPRYLMKIRVLMAQTYYPALGLERSSCRGSTLCFS